MGIPGISGIPAEEVWKSDPSLETSSVPDGLHGILAPKKKKGSNIKSGFRLGIQQGIQGPFWTTYDYRFFSSLREINLDPKNTLSTWPESDHPPRGRKVAAFCEESWESNVYLRHFGHLLDHLDSNPATIWESIQVPATHHVVHVVPCDFSRPGPSPGVSRFPWPWLRSYRSCISWRQLHAWALPKSPRNSGKRWTRMTVVPGLEVDGCWCFADFSCLEKMELRLKLG